MLTQVQQSPGGRRINYTYNADGLRTKKVVREGSSTTTTEYMWGSNGLAGYRTGNTTVIVLYDSEGSPVGFSVDGQAFTYVKNLQGDVIRILDRNGNIMVSYTYDPWGVPAITGDIVLAEINPCSYRGYDYDEETGYYYLQSRYYDPEIGRFLNADDVSFLGMSESSIGYNLFAYCENSPVASADPLGHFRISLTWATILIDGLLHLIPYVVSLFASAKVFAKAASLSIWARKAVEKLTKQIAKGIVSFIEELVYKWAGHVAHAAATAFLRKGIEGIIGSLLNLSPGYLIAYIISLFGKEPGKAVSF